jgi:hypothetical protein
MSDLVQCRTIRIFPRVREEQSAYTTAYALFLGQEPRPVQRVEWYAQELALDDEKRPVWRLLATAVVLDMEGTP